MNPDYTHKTMTAALIVIGIIIIIILLSPRGYSTYSYQGSNAFTASALPIQQIDNRPQTGTYSFVRYLPTRNSSTTTTTGSQYTYYTYPTTSTDYSYQTYDQGVVFPDGCTMTSSNSTTTGLPCS